MPVGHHQQVVQESCLAFSRQIRFCSAYHHVSLLHQEPCNRKVITHDDTIGGQPELRYQNCCDGTGNLHCKARGPTTLALDAMHSTSSCVLPETGLTLLLRATRARMVGLLFAYSRACGGRCLGSVPPPAAGGCCGMHQTHGVLPVRHWLQAVCGRVRQTYLHRALQFAMPVGLSRRRSA